jgi:hypothetical protein
MMSLGEINDTSPILTSFTMSEQTAKSDIDEDSYYEYDTSMYFVSVDTEGLLTYSATLTSGLTLPDWIDIDSTTGILSGTPSDVDTGALDILVTATNSLGESVSDNYVLTVNDVNTTPTIDATMPNITVNVGDDENALNIDPSNFFSDADGDVLTYTVTSERPDGSDLFTETLSQWNSVEGVISNEELGDWLITVNASDGQANVSQTFNISVNPEPTTQLIQIRNAETITKARASIDEYGQDYTSVNTDKLMRFELWIDATDLSSYNAAATEIRGYQFDMNWNDTEVGALNFPTIAGTNVGFNATNSENAAITFNSTNGSVAIASSTAIVDTDVSNDGPPSFLGVEQLIGTFYMNPNADIETMTLSLNNILIVTDTDNISPADYTTVLKISNMDATIQTDANNYLDNVSLSYFKDGLDTGVFTLVEGGDINFPDTSLDFDVVKLSDPVAYTDGIQADDAVAILRDIVFLDIIETGSTTWHSADVNNDGQIAADDAVAILRHIVILDEIDTFDLIDNTTGNRISSLDTNAIDVGQWTIVANGDVNGSGSFNDTYTVAVDIV